ncbi:MAG: M48 family metalloprotease [Gomphosphaeria aponina SAG 52.96 = DSM 107014]|uniref:M48 family metalloprotease n=1 Tax=Gomphosphaeria aponina SAG 52.96 = DSM 107014 TaxID=1521640 RepID=A0A941GUZ3_9CHRO|nr:M48 family metalloprotease [Gomphosphaeria aponina SAG 52.96 = DSM 107014]
MKISKLGKIITGALLITLIIIFGNRPVVSYTEKPTVNQRINPGQIAQVGSASYYQQLAKADDFYKGGNLQMAEQIQREVKPDFPPSEPPASPIFDEENLKEQEPGAAVYWRIANEGIGDDLESKILEPLTLLTEDYPRFIPGHLVLAEQLVKYERTPEAIEVLAKASTLYPEITELLDGKIALLRTEERYLEAAIAARQFALSYPDNPQAGQYENLAKQNQQDHNNYIQQQIVSGALADMLLEEMFGGNGSSNTLLTMLMQGEAQTGEQMAQQYKSQLTLVENEQLVNYVTQVGMKLAQLMGRDEFNYEFFIVDDPNLNAFALPGGKIFINTGMLKVMGSEAELAGILSHEISHSVLSHSFEKMATAASLEGFGQVLPLGSIFSDFITAEHSREKERQSDIVGTHALATAGYAADGLYNVMGILKQAHGDAGTPWTASHPAPTERVEYLAELIQRHGYNRYAYEGVNPYQTALGNTPKKEQSNSEPPTQNQPIF